jgi:hypothetical protein
VTHGELGGTSRAALTAFVKEVYEVGRAYDGRPVAVVRGTSYPFLLDTVEGRAAWHLDVLRTRRWGRDTGVPYDDLENSVASLLAILAHEAQEGGSTITHLAGEWGQVLAEADARKLNRRELVQDYVRESRHLVARRLAQQQEDLREVGDRPIGVVLSVAEADLHYADIGGHQLLPGLMPRRGIGTIFGPSGAAKTLTYLYRDLCLANQRPFFGVMPSERVGSIVVPLEDAASIHLRLRAAAARHEMSTEGVLIVGDAMLTALNAALIDRFMTEVLIPARDRLEASGLPLGVVSIDTQRWLIPGQSVSDDRATSMVSALLARIANELTCVAEVAAHSPLADELRQAGSQEQKGSRDYEWSVRSKALHLAKLKNGQPRRVGHFTTEGRLVELPRSSTALPMSLPENVEMPVLVEITDVEAATAAEMPGTGVLIVDEANAWNIRDQNTAVELLRILHEPWPVPSKKAEKEKLGWTNTDVAKALEGLASRPAEDGGPVDVHTNKRFYTAVLDGLHGQELITDHTEAWKTGMARAWALTEDGRTVLKELTGEVL